MNTRDHINLFYSYAHNDETLRNELDKHLSSLRRGGLIAQWHDRDISAGTDWTNQINHHLNAAQVILLLISSDFLASDYCYSIEMNRALKRHNAGEARVIPILLRPVDWQGAPFSKLQALPQNACPVTAWTNQDLAFSDVAIQIRRVVNELQTRALESFVTSNTLQASLKCAENVLMDVVDGEAQQTLLSHSTPQTIKDFRYCQGKVEELKSIHNSLHEIQVQLDGLTATIQLITQDEKEKKKLPFKRSFMKSDVGRPVPDLSYVEIVWRQTVLKIGNLEFFATEEMKVLEDERLCFDSGGIRGPLWVTELSALKEPFNIGMKELDIEVIKKNKCRACYKM